MGLDNGIMLKIKDKEKFGEIPVWIRREPWEDEHNYDYEILYWRKCWNVRAEILTYLAADDDEYEWNLSLMELRDILKILNHLYNWHSCDSSQSIWSWDEIKDTYLNNLEYARKVLKWLETKPADSFEIYFYDSY